MLRGNKPAAVFRAAVVAHVLASEHAAIGPLVTRHAELYKQMQTAPLRDLPLLARRRYEDTGLELVEVPTVVDSGGELGVDT